jgi:hypothetical protein
MRIQRNNNQNNRRALVNRMNSDKQLIDRRNQEQEDASTYTAEPTEEQKQGNEEFQDSSVEYIKSNYFDSSKTDFIVQQGLTYYYLDKQNELISDTTKYDDATLKKKEVKALTSIIPSKTLRDDFIRGYNASKHFKELVKQADFYNGTIQAATETSTTSEFDEKNQYAGSKIKIIPGADKNSNANTTTNVGKMSWELTNMKNHNAFIDLETKARAKSIDKVAYVKGIMAIEAEAAFNEKLVILDAHGLYIFKELEKYDKMNSAELEKNKSQFIKDYVIVTYDTTTIEKQGKKILAKDKYGADYDEYVKEGPLKAPSVIQFDDH